ncbi:hypothetical protein FOZ62_002090 [Perkinsus olseni]|uniref:Uncharacterized protein n=1 Tax=Perkinsus olseni TaxID=32597 RepID=A0A7J6QQV9_PEROL|nr:hypothetical protein FOZ62_002090 [Perkinsus olseni]
MLPTGFTTRLGALLCSFACLLHAATPPSPRGGPIRSVRHEESATGESPQAIVPSRAVDPDSTLHNFDVVNVVQTDDSRGVNAVRACRVSQMKNSLTFYVDDREKNVVKTTEVRCGRYNWIRDFDYGAIQLVGMDGIDYNVLYGREITTTPLDRLLPEQYVGESVTEENCRSMVRDIRDFAFMKTGAHLFGYLCPSYLTLNEGLFVDPQVHSSRLLGADGVLLVLTRRGLASSNMDIPPVPIREIKGHEIDVQEMTFYEDGAERYGPVCEISRYANSLAFSLNTKSRDLTLVELGCKSYTWWHDPLTHSLVRRTPDGECQVLEDTLGEVTEVLATTTLKASPSDPITKQFCGDAVANLMRLSTGMGYREPRMYISFLCYWYSTPQVNRRLKLYLQSVDDRAIPTKLRDAPTSVLVSVLVDLICDFEPAFDKLFVLPPPHCLGFILNQANMIITLSDDKISTFRSDLASVFVQGRTVKTKARERLLGRVSWVAMPFIRLRPFLKPFHFSLAVGKSRNLPSVRVGKEWADAARFLYRFFGSGASVPMHSLLPDMGGMNRTVVNHW